MTLLTTTYWFVVLPTLVTGLSLFMLLWRKTRTQKAGGLVPLLIGARRK